MTVWGDTIQVGQVWKSELICLFMGLTKGVGFYSKWNVKPYKDMWQVPTFSLSFLQAKVRCRNLQIGEGNSMWSVWWLFQLSVSRISFFFLFFFYMIIRLRRAEFSVWCLFVFYCCNQNRTLSEMSLSPNKHCLLNEQWLDERLQWKWWDDGVLSIIWRES